MNLFSTDPPVLRSAAAVLVWGSLAATAVAGPPANPLRPAYADPSPSVLIDPGRPAEAGPTPLGSPGDAAQGVGWAGPPDDRLLFAPPRERPFYWSHRADGLNPWLPGLRDLFCHGDPDDRGRHVGLGQPLVGTSWLNRPYHVGWLVGVLVGDRLISGRVDQGSDVFGGYRIGADFDHYWGWEGRFGFAYLPVDHTLAAGETLPALRDSEVLFWDAAMLWYPWGDARWRPYATVGVGAHSFHFRDPQNVRRNEVLFGMPFGVGLKYLWKKWLALRLDALDNLAFSGDGLETMHNWSFTVGVEVHGGGWRRSYYPWSPSIHLF